MKFFAVLFGMALMLAGGGIVFLVLAFMSDLGADTGKYLSGLLPVMLIGLAILYFGFRVLAGVNAADKLDREG